MRLVWSLLGLGVSGVNWVRLPEGAWLWSGGAEEGRWAREEGRGKEGVSVCPQETGTESLGYHVLPDSTLPRAGQGAWTFRGALGASSPLPPL